MSKKANSDELATFVASTLRAIAAGIHDAQDVKIATPHGSGVNGFNAPKEIEFDIAVSARTTGDAESGLKIAVFGISAGLGANVANESSTVSRIKFSIPTAYKKHPEDIPSPPTTRTAFNSD